MIFYTGTLLKGCFIQDSVGYRGRDRVSVEFTATYAICAYHYWCCEIESRSGRGVQQHVIKFVSDLRQVGGFFPRTPYSSTNKNRPPRYNWTIVESGVKHHKPNQLLLWPHQFIIGMTSLTTLPFS